MSFPARKPWVAYCIIASLAPFIMGSTGLTSNFSQRVLAAQNRERERMGVGPLRWNEELARSAQTWADHLAATQTFEHAPDSNTDPQGENLWAGTKDYYSTEAMVDGWIREKRFFRVGLFPYNSTSGRVEDIGHYTQLIWRRTGQVGCARATGAREDILVCRYSEAGNYLGERPL